MRAVLPHGYGSLFVKDHVPQDATMLRIAHRCYTLSTPVSHAQTSTTMVSALQIVHMMQALAVAVLVSTVTITTLTAVSSTVMRWKL
jgi:hypothetical protein